MHFLRGVFAGADEVSGSEGLQGSRGLFTQKACLYGRMEMRMRMIRGSGLLSTFFTYKTARRRPARPGKRRTSRPSARTAARAGSRTSSPGTRGDLRAGLHGDQLPGRRLSHLYARMDARLCVVVVRRHDGPEDGRRPGEQPDQPRDDALQCLGERQHRVGRRAGRRRAARLPVRQLDQVLPVRQRPVRARLDRRLRQLRYDALGGGQLDVRRQPGRLRSEERGRSGRHADSRHHDRSCDRIQRHGSD